MENLSGQIAQIFADYSKDTGYGYDYYEYSSDMINETKNLGLDIESQDFEYYDNEDKMLEAAKAIAKRKFTALAAQNTTELNIDLLISMLDPISSFSQWHSSSCRC